MERSKKNTIISYLDKIIVISLYGIAYFIPISKAIIEILIYLAIASFLVKKIMKAEDISHQPLNLVVFLYLFICLVSIFTSSNASISARSFLGKVLQNLTVFFIAVDSLQDERKIKNFIYFLFASGFLLGIDGIYQYFTHEDFIRNRPDFMIQRIYATFPSPSDFGCYLITVIPFTLAVFFAKFSYRITRFLFLALFILLFSCLLLTVSRGAWFAFIASILFMSIWIRVLALFFLILGICIIVLQPFFNVYIRQRLSNFFTFVDNSSSDRKFIWEAGWKMFLSSPWVGVGLGTFMFNFKKFVAANFVYIAYAHNCYLQMLAEIGIIGLTLFLSILAVFFYSGIKALNCAKEKTFSWFILLGSLAAILGYCVQMSVDTMFYSLDLGVFFWLILGLGGATIKYLKTDPVI